MAIMSNSDTSKHSYCLAHNENISITTDGVSDNRRAKIDDPHWVFEMLASHVAKKKRKKKGADYVCKMAKNVRTKKLFNGTYSLLSSRTSSVLSDQSFSTALRHKHTHTKLGISLCPLEDKSLSQTLSSCEEICQVESVGTSKVNSAVKA